jgi:hypothetical protein
MSSLTEDFCASSFWEAFTAKGPMFFQPREGPCSKAVTWSVSAFFYEVPATFLREKEVTWETLHCAMLETLYPAQSKVFVTQIAAFLPLVEELALLFC